ncbi:tyrosine-protein phosphatase [Lentzea sp. NPDC092896]|uniref:tyrosine-protein phosphatase n=1 Tax=Lentzea sp. NPDC092896 TaxID=3364127 RepID=UPI0037F671A7
MTEVGGVNFRVVAAGGVPGGRLLRSGDSTAFTAAQSENLVAELGLRTVVDLRSPAEIDRYGPPLALVGAGVRWLSLPLDGYPRESVSARRPGVGDRVEYLRAILTSSAPGRWAALVAGLAEVAAEPFLLTCHFGKDRTGVAVMLALALADASEEDIAADYAAGAADLAANVDRFQDKWIRRGHSREDYLGRMRTSPKTAIEWLSWMRRTYGGAEAALVAAGAAPADVARLRGVLS